MLYRIPRATERETGHRPSARSCIDARETLSIDVESEQPVSVNLRIAVGEHEQGYTIGQFSHCFCVDSWIVREPSLFLGDQRLQRIGSGLEGSNVGFESKSGASLGCERLGKLSKCLFEFGVVPLLPDERSTNPDHRNRSQLEQCSTVALPTSYSDGEQVSGCGGVCCVGFLARFVRYLRG